MIIHRTATVLACASLACMLGIVPDAHAQIASAFQINPGHSGSTHFNPPLALPLMQKWKITLPGPVSYPLIAHGLVVVLSGGQSGVGSTQLVALDETTGKLVWAQPISGTSFFWAGHAYDNGKIYVVNANGMLSQFDGVTGKPGWFVQLPFQYLFDSPPTAANGFVYTGGAGSGGTVYAVDETTGTVTWTASVMNGDSSSPAVSKSGVYVSYACNNTYGFNPVNGNHLWTHFGNCEGGGGLTPVLSPSLGLFARDDISGNLLFDAKTGATRGTFTADLPPAIEGTVGYSVAQGSMIAYDYKRGTELWGYKGKQPLTSAPIVVDGTVFVGDSAGNLFGLDGKNGKVKWQANLGAPISAPGEGGYGSPVAGLGAGDGLVIVPAGNILAAFGQ